MQAIESEASRRVIEAQFEGITARLRKEAPQFLRDLGGQQALLKAREAAQPPQDHWWWYLDAYLAEKRKAALKRTLVLGSAVTIVLLILAVVYQVFLAPDPEVAARYQHEQGARDALMYGDYADALEEVDAGLRVAPQDPTLLILKGVILEALGRIDEAEHNYEQAEQLVPNPEELLIIRGQAYVMNNLPEKALADALEAIRTNPQSPQAYLLLGQAHEMLYHYAEALKAYDQAYTSAEGSNQLELAALARTRTAMLMQSMNVQMATPAPSLTP
jgi:tetratricopeptide (TPR) repeat protein